MLQVLLLCNNANYLTPQNVFRGSETLKPWNFLTNRQTWCLQGKSTISKNSVLKNALDTKVSGIVGWVFIPFYNFFVIDSYRMFLMGSLYESIPLWSNGLVVKALDSQSRSPVFKTTGWLQGRLSLHPSEVDKMSTRNFWELNGKK